MSYYGLPFIFEFFAEKRKFSTNSIEIQLTVELYALQFQLKKCIIFFVINKKLPYRKEGMTKMDCGEKIAFLRKRDGMTQAELGDALNVTYQAVSKWERGESRPDFDTISKIAKLFKVPISAFEEGEAIPPAAAEEVAATAVAEPAVQEKLLVGTCTQCGRVIYEGDEASTEPKLVCKSCLERNKQAAILKKKQEEEARRKAEQDAANKIRWEKEALKRKRNRGLWVSAIIAGIVLIATTVYSLLPSNEFGFPLVFGGGIALTLIIYCFTTQMIWGGIVRDVCLGGGFCVRMPGVIFSLSPDGLFFLIFAKIFLGLIAALIFIGSILLCVIVALFISPFAFVPALLKKNYEIAKVR